MMEIPIKLLYEGAQAPVYAHVGDAGLDLRCTEDIELAPFQRAAVPTGMAIELPEGFAALVLPRSGLAVRHGISLVNAPGLIDSNYRGEIKVIMINLDPENTFRAKRGERIAQLMVIRVEQVSLVVCEDLADTERGEAGFGSSGTA